MIADQLVDEPKMDRWLPDSKLAPEALAGIVIDRPRLVGALHRAIRRHRLTLLSTPLGYGKSVLLDQWTQSLAQTTNGDSLRAAWLSLDESENDRTQFLLALIAALQVLHPKCGVRAKAFLTEDGYPEPIDPTTLAHVLSGLIIIDIAQYVPEPFALILDNYERISEPSVHSAVDYLLRRLPQQAHLIISTTQDPPLSLARLKAYNLAVEFRAQDIAFDMDETAMIVRRQLGTELPSTLQAMLHHCTEGWPAAVELTVREMSTIPIDASPLNYLTRACRDPDGSPLFPTLDALLYQESFQVLPAPLRRFLLQTSVLHILEPERCTAVTGQHNTSDLLSELVQRNLFIFRCQDTRLHSRTQTGDVRHQRMRYHRLFAAFLHGRLRRELPGEMHTLHQRAAQVEPEPLYQVSHCIGANLWQEAAEAILKVSRLPDLTDTERSHIPRWVDRLPASVRSKYPDLMTLRRIHPASEAGSALGLTRRQCEVLGLLAEEASNQEIADELVITVSTAKEHVGQILRKLEVSNRRAAVQRAAELHLLSG